MFEIAHTASWSFGHTIGARKLWWFQDLLRPCSMAWIWATTRCIRTAFITIPLIFDHKGQKVLQHDLQSRISYVSHRSPRRDGIVTLLLQDSAAPSGTSQLKEPIRKIHSNVHWVKIQAQALPEGKSPHNSEYEVPHTEDRMKRSGLLRVIQIYQWSRKQHQHKQPGAQPPTSDANGRNKIKTRTCNKAVTSLQLDFDRLPFEKKRSSQE